MGNIGQAKSDSAAEATLPVTFDALVIEQAGKPVSLQQKTITSLGEDEMLIRVSYASINKMDPALALRNVFQLSQPYVLGFDFSGEVVKLDGKGEGSFKVGDQVFGSSRAGLGGCFAEYVVAKNSQVILRGAVPAPEASTYGIAYLTAYESLVITGDIQRQRGKWIYIAGAGGGLGHFAAQIAKLHGLKVIGTAGKPTSLGLLRQLQLDYIIDYSKQNVVEEIMRLTGGKGVDLVYDSTYSQSSYMQSTAVVASGGKYIRLGTAAQMTQFGLEDMTTVVEGRGAKMVIADLGRYSTDPLYVGQRPKVAAGLRQAVRWYEEGKLRPIITQVIPFDSAALQRAFEDFLKGTINVGKVVVQCGQRT
jgi:NADPH:quinone reductase-like Zn-dependent oxidoreductase